MLHVRLDVHNPHPATSGSMPCNIEAGLQGVRGEVLKRQSQLTSACTSTQAGLVNHFLHRRFPQKVTGVLEVMMLRRVLFMLLIGCAHGRCSFV